MPQDFIDEALVLSDILELNELFAVELLLAGEQQQPDFPSLTRGLVSVLLYHDGRRNLVTALRNLIQVSSVNHKLHYNGSVTQKQTHSL